jgi:hypothetical protein
MFVNMIVEMPVPRLTLLLRKTKLAATKQKFDSTRVLCPYSIPRTTGGIDADQRDELRKLHRECSGWRGLRLDLFQALALCFGKNGKCHDESQRAGNSRYGLCSEQSLPVQQIRCGRQCS